MGKEYFTLGVEEEFQLVDLETNQLCSGVDRLLDKGATRFGKRIKAELVQSAIEITSDVCPDIASVRNELYRNRTDIARLAEESGMTLISGGTHPVSAWQDQQITDRDHYLRLVEEQQDAVRVHVIFGLHVHVGIQNKEVALKIMNQARTWLPHLLALSSNSPFWCGRFTGIKSYRSVLWHGGLRSGIPEVFPSLANFHQYVEDLMSAGYIRDSSDIWWDLRLHPIFDTIEFRVCDMPSTIEDSIALTALCQALVAKLAWLARRGREVSSCPRDYIMENKWQALRYGLDATIADFVTHRRLPMRESVHELLDFVGDVVDDLGSSHEMNYLRSLLLSPEGTGADRQITVYKQTGDITNVLPFLISQTLQGISIPGGGDKVDV